jgi:antitoxin component YwqK of YwqJK toxin-antitoxin module
MKKLFGIILLLTSTFSYGVFGLFSEPVCVDGRILQERHELFYLPNETQPFTGGSCRYYKNSQKKLEYNFKDGRFNGKSTLWHENGQKELEVNFKDGNREGKLTSWSENGQKLFEENYKDGELIEN